MGVAGGGGGGRREGGLPSPNRRKALKETIRSCPGPVAPNQHLRKWMRWGKGRGRRGLVRGGGGEGLEGGGWGGVDTYVGIRRTRYINE